MAVTPQNPSVFVNATLQLFATGTYSDSSIGDVTPITSWTSSTPSIATVGGNGLARGVAFGQATVQASVGSLGGSATLSVTGFAPTANVNIARQGQTATLLTNGTVLFAGGSDANFAEQASAELYNPVSGSISATGTMTTPRTNHTATLLNDGTVLIAGGSDTNGVPLNSAEIYNPITATFTAVTNMSTGRTFHAATLLGDGTVLIAGGYDSNSNALASAELYDPATGTFTGLGNLMTGRASHTATLLNNGKVLIAGGQDTNFNALAAGEVYDPSTRTFTATGSLNTARDLHTATLLNNGIVLIAGGQDTNTNPQSGAELYDPNAGTFTVTGSMTTARISDTATLLNNGTVLIVGGASNYCNAFSSTEVYDPVAQTFSASANLNYPRTFHTTTLLNNGLALIAGGLNRSTTDISCSQTTEAAAEVYDPKSFAPPGLVSIAVTPATPTNSVGIAQDFIATGTFSDSSTQVLSSATWSSSDNTLTTVTNDWTNFGHAFAVATGSPTVTACTGSICGSTTLTGTAAQLIITRLSPAAGVIGAQVIIAGTGFGSTQGSSTVTFNGTAATVSNWNPTGIVATVPAGATTGNVVVTVSGASSNGTSFTVTSSPVIINVSLSIGVPGTPVTISGSNFGTTQGISNVTFNGIIATPSSWSDTSIVATVPNGATMGNIVATVSGLASNGVEFAPTSISSVSPLSGPDGTLVTIAGAGFGSTPGSDVVSIGSVPMGVLRWSNTLILAIVGHGTTIGNVILHQGSVALAGPIFDASQPVPYIVSPATLNMLVGETHTVAVTDTFGTPVYGLQWVTSNSDIVSLSSDYPPVLTAVAVGSATVYAGGASVSVTVSAGSSLPNGTTIWSLPLTAPTLGQLELVPAVPSSSGVDVFAFDATGYLSAVSSDGHLVSKTHLGSLVGSVLASSAIPDFQGGALVKGLYSFIDSGGGQHNTHNVFRYDPTTRQASLVYTFTNLFGMDPGLFSDSQSFETIIPDTTGVVFIQDNDTVTIFNEATGQQIASVNEPPAFETGHMIVAGDGNAYVPFLYITNSGASSDLKLLRVSPDGSNANIDLGGGQFGSLYVITNGDAGVAVFSNDGFANPSPIRMTLVSNDAVISQNDVYTPPAPGLNFIPILQREDSSYIGSNNGGAVVAVGPSNTLWVQQLVPFGSGQVRPLYATSDGGMIVTSTPAECAGGDISTADGVTFGCLLNQGLTPWQTGYGQLGTLYTLDQYGNATSQTADTGAAPSWAGNWYVDPPGQVTSVLDLPVYFARTFAALFGGNNSENGASIGQVASNEPPGPAKQLPPAGAKFQSNYNSIELITTQSLDTIFSRFLQTYDGIRKPNNTVVTVISPDVVTGPGQNITFEMLGTIGLLGSLPLANCGTSGVIVSCPVQGPFSVQTERFDPAAHTISAVTLQGHPIAGWRYWRAFSVGTNDVVVETGAVDTHAAGPVNWAGYYALKSVQIESWRQYMQYILTTLRTLDPSAHQGSTPNYNIVSGEWNQSPSQAYILNNVCQALSCN